MAVVPNFHKRILFSDEAHFWLNGYVNKQNCRIWSEANPPVYVETPLHPEKLTVWIWNLFLETESAGRRPGQGHRRATTPNEDHYLVLMAEKHRNMNATLLQQHLRSATGTTVSTQTVRKWLHGVRLYARQPLVCVRLTSRHRRDLRE
ncbi:transposable element Tcb2 transposase [Trichonephila clavipes]|nr:transposable element Tcb2 transposase [Trichonephila clavipes]